MGQYSTEGISGSMAFKRRCTSGGTDSFALVTVTDAATYSGIPNGTYRDAVTGDVKTVSNGSLSVAAPGKETCASTSSTAPERSERTVPT
jgi:hypothetical protein